MIRLEPKLAGVAIAPTASLENRWGRVMLTRPHRQGNLSRLGEPVGVTQKSLHMDGSPLPSPRQGSRLIARTQPTGTTGPHTYPKEPGPGPTPPTDGGPNSPVAVTNARPESREKCQVLISFG